MSLGDCEHTSVRNVLHYWEKAYLNSNLAVFKGVRVGINPENLQWKIFRISFLNTHARSNYCIIGRPNDREAVICTGPQQKYRRKIAQK